MLLYRIADGRFEPAGGEGARLYGGRWNSPGRAVIYAATTFSGAMLEKLVHTGRRVPRHQVCVIFEVPDDLTMRTLQPHEVPGWDQPDELVSRSAGDAWLSGGESALLFVPSVVQKMERNALINPLHPDAARVRVLDIESVRWDVRLFQASPLPTP